MTSKEMRSFAGGLLVAASLCGFVYFSSSADATPASKPAEKLSNEEMKDLLTAKGYVIYTEKEWNQLADEKAKDKEEKKDSQKDSKKENTEKEKVVYRTVLNVSSGMTSIDVGRSLVRAKIIDNANAFSKEVEKRGLANELRPGIYEVESGMDMNKIISIIFPK
ncbi:hypothetical protein [Bacillus sp. S/N-304-OC-R1]|uniref:hypothetical protein n=1 Tax=Bacillus sp. S/N-304-OC-R1 TaxID=2758034 RepID=UPI001C8D92D7|nr:hypothetical protein [Bacillus sp. S/N-304-OC-R1]MBY0121418.1 hypothetical protein [Bacillus sp. S/N-304-OC-R1]